MPCDVQKRADRGHQLAIFDEAQARARLAPEHQIGADRQRFDEAQVLIDDGDAGLTRLRGRVERDPLAVDFDDAFVVRMDAAEYLDQRGFARAVFAQQRVDFAGQDFEIRRRAAPARRQIAW